MKKNIPIVVIGFGSIGRRHYQNLLNLGYKNVWVYDISPRQVKGFVGQRLTRLNRQSLHNFSVAFICTPAHKHIPLALLCAQAGCHLFIEKPLSHSLSKLSQLIVSCKQNRLVNMVACNMRFHPCLRYIYNYLSLGKLGQVYSINLEFGYYLPDWRPNQDYTKFYYGSPKKGGGIILDDIHEFDLLFWLNDFNKVKESKFTYGKASKLAINTEDICFDSFRFSNNVFGSVKCDYLQRHYSRSCKVVGELGSLTWDFDENFVWLLGKNKKKKLYHANNLKVNDMYVEELKYFMGRLNAQTETGNDIQRATQVLAACINR